MTAQTRRQKGPYTLANARLRVEYLQRAGVESARVNDQRQLSAPDDRDGSEARIKACYVSYETAERDRVLEMFAAKPWDADGGAR